MSWFVTFFRPKTIEQQLDRELRFHLESRIEDLTRLGRTPEQARRDALVEFGGVEAAKEGCRDERGGQWLETLWQDVRYAVRQLRKDAAFTTTVGLTLALGIGGFTIIYSVVDGLLLHPRDVPDIERVVMIKDLKPGLGASGVTSVPNYRDWRAQATSFAGMAIDTQGGTNLTGLDEPLTVIASTVSANFFEVLGAKPILGRGFLLEEEQTGYVAVLSHGLWRAKFGGDPGIVGRSIQLNFGTYTVVGVAPAWMDDMTQARPLWKLTGPDNANARNRGYRWSNVIARLKPGVTIDQAQAEMDQIGARLAAEYPEANTGAKLLVVPRLAYISQQWRDWIWTLLAAVVVVLLIACANAANLLFARGTARQREMAVRAALGAGRMRLVRQLLTESVLLALLGGVAGMGLAIWGLDGLRALAPSVGIERLAQVDMNVRILGMAMGAMLVTALIFGLAPAWLAAGADVRQALSQGTRGSSEGGTRGKLRRLLVVAEVALALTLLAGAGLFIRSFIRLTRFDYGFSPANATSVWLQARDTGFGGPAGLQAFYDALLERIRQVSGIKFAGYGQGLPLLGWPEKQNTVVRIEGRPPVEDNDAPHAYTRGVSAGFFEAMGMRLIRGRLFGPADVAGHPRVAIINETFAREHFRGEDPLGRQLDPRVEIIGIVADATIVATDQAKEGQVYFAYTQAVPAPGSIMIIARTEGRPEALHPALVAAVRAANKDVPVYGMMTLEDAVRSSAALRRFAMLVVVLFSTVALALAAVGLYGVMAYAVTQRRTEIGIRMALGGQVRDILSLVMGDGARLVGAGVAIGLLLALGLGELIESRLFETSARDPVTLAGISLFFTGVAAAACWIPARRAARVNPIVVLRADG